MCRCCIHINDDDAMGSGRAANGEHSKDNDKFQITMRQAPCKEPACCLGTLFCCWYSQEAMREKVLNRVNPSNGLDDYICCQGIYSRCCGYQPGECGEKTCPFPCMCIETCLCPGPAAYAPSLVLRRKYRLGLDKDDVSMLENSVISELCFSSRPCAYWDRPCTKSSFASREQRNHLPLSLRPWNAERR